MRIAIAGASGTGKTTLARVLSEKYSIPLNPVGARSVALEMGFDSPYDVDAAGKRLEFQKRLFEAKRDWELAHESFVTDRTYLDNLTYCALHMAEDLPPDAIDVYQLAMLRYSLVLRVWVSDFQSLGDGVRKLSPTYHDLYERILSSLLSEVEAVPVVDLRFLTALPERVSAVSQTWDRISGPVPSECERILRGRRLKEDDR